MPRQIPIELQQHLAGSHTTYCILVKITPVQPGYPAYGVTTLDADITYDDGSGPLLYSAAVGTELTTIASSSDLSVDVGESRSLMPVYDIPVSEADLIRGAYDFAKFAAYLVNYEDLTAGRHTLLQTGTLGRNTVTDSGLSFTAELRGLAQGLRQTITEKWSLSCRATFGSKPKGVYSMPVSISNAGFELGNASGWTLGDGMAVTTSAKKSGAYGLECSGGTGEIFAVHESVPVAQGRSITASCMYHQGAASSGKNPGQVALLWYDDAMVQIGAPSLGNIIDSSSGGFQRSSVTATVPAGASRVSIAGRVFRNQSNSCYFDDFSWDLSIDNLVAPPGAVTERYPCMYDSDSLWQPGQVTGVGLETTRTFTTSGLTPPFGGVPGMVRWLTGRNTGREDEVEGFAQNDGPQTIDLTFTTMFPIQVGDTFEFRDDCPKTPTACKARSNWQWYRAEPTIPVADNGAIAAGSIAGSAGNVTTTTEAAP